LAYPLPDPQNARSGDLRRSLFGQIAGFDTCVEFLGQILNMFRIIKWGDVCERLPFSQSHATRFMKIAGNEVIRNCAHVQDLPTDTATLYSLARLPAPELEQHLEAGRVRPDMSRQEASALSRGEPLPPKKEPSTDDQEQTDKAARELAALDAAWRKARPSVRRQFFLDNRAWFDQRIGK